MRSLDGTHAAGLGLGLDLAPIPVCLWTRKSDEFICVEVNDAMCGLSGRPREDFIGSTITELGGNNARAKRDMLEATLSGKSLKRDRTWVLQDGTVRQLEISYVPLGPSQLLAFALDVTHERAAAERLRLTENRYQTLVATANHGVWLVAADGRTVFANPQVARILDRPFIEIAQSNLLTFVDPADRATVAGAIRCPRDAPHAFEARFRRHDGTPLLCLLSVSPMPGADDTAETLCVLADMTRLQHERELRLATERRYRRMVETASEGVWTGDREGRTTFVNEAGARMLGVDRDEILGRSFTDFIVYDAQAVAAREKITRDGHPIHGEFRLRRSDGSAVDVIASVSLLRDDNGVGVGSLAMLTDVTQMKREQAELKESRERFASVFNEAPIGIAFIGAGHLVRGRFLAANAAFHDLLGYSDHALLEHDIFSVTHPDDVAAERDLANALFDRRTDEYSLDKRFIRVDGEAVWARFRAHVLRDANGAPLYALGIAVDISAERRAQASAARLQAQYDALLNTGRDGVFEIAPDGTIVAANGAGLLLLGLERVDVVGRAFPALVPDRLRERVRLALAGWFRAAQHGQAIDPTETTMRRSDGSEFPVQVRVAPIRSDGDRLLLQVRNLGLRDAAEAARREAEERFERLFRDSPTPVFAVDTTGRLNDVNPAFCELLGKEPAGLLGRNADDVLADAGDASELPWRAGMDRPGPVSVSRRVARADGRSQPLKVTASLVRDAGGVPLQWLCQCTPQLVGVAVEFGEGQELSYRERQVLGLLAHGHDGPAIAERLGLAPETVRSYANSAREKLGAKTRTEAVAIALVRGAISI